MHKLMKATHEFYPEYLKAHSNRANRLLHFLGATLFFIFTALFFISWQWYYIPIAVFTGYLLPGIGHHFLQHNDSFRATKPVICVLCATKLYWDTLTLRIAKKMKMYTISN